MALTRAKLEANILLDPSSPLIVLRNDGVIPCELKCTLSQFLSFITSEVYKGAVDKGVLHDSTFYDPDGHY